MDEGMKMKERKNGKKSTLILKRLIKALKRKLVIT